MDGGWEAQQLAHRCVLGEPMDVGFRGLGFMLLASGVQRLQFEMLGSKGAFHCEHC